MQRTVKFRITTTRKRTINASISAQRVFCRNCGHEVKMLTSQQAAELLGTGQTQLVELIALGKVHAMGTVSGTLCICEDSLI